MTEPEPLYIVSVDSSLYDSAEWFSHIRYKLSQSQSLNRAYRWVCWPFSSIPEALAAVQRCPENEFVYLRIDPTEEVLSSYSGGNRQYLDKALEPVRRRNCIVVFEADHTNVSGIDAGAIAQDQADNASNLIKALLEKRSTGKSALLASRIDDVSAFGMQAIDDIRRQITVLTGRCDRIDREMEILQDIVQEHSEDLQTIRAWVGRGKGLLGAIGKKAIAQLLLAMGAGAGLTWLIEALFGSQ